MAETTAVRLARVEERLIRNGDAAERAAIEVGELAKLVREEIVAIRAEVASERKKRIELETQIAVLKGTARGISIGWAGAFAFIGGVIATGVSQIVEFFR